MSTKTERIKAELLAIKDSSRDSMLHAEKVVAWAKQHSRSALHSEFEWNNSVAAKEYRLWQARRLIQITVVSDGGTPQLVSLTTDRSRGGGYRAVADVQKDRKLTEVMLSDAIRDLERVQARFGRVRQLAAMWKEFDRVRTKIASGSERAKAA